LRSAVSGCDDVVAVQEERSADAVLLGEAFDDRARLVGVHHPGAVRRRRAAEIGDELVQRYCLPDVRLSVICAEHDRVPREQLVEAAGCVHERFHRRVGAC
jgi:hypothetical protein